jgi:hypothetical protein
MVTTQRKKVLAGAGAAAVALLYFFVLRGSSAPSPVQPVPGGPPRAGAGRAESEGALPRIGLERADQALGRAALPVKRDVFAFGVDPQVEIERERLANLPPPLPVEPTPTPVPTPTPLPPLNVKYIGSLESKPGLKVAFFMTEKKEVLSGQAGDTVMNRFRVMRINIESVDVQQVGADQVQRLPLKGN